MWLGDPGDRKRKERRTAIDRPIGMIGDEAFIGILQTISNESKMRQIYGNTECDVLGIMMREGENTLNRIIGAN